MTVMDYSMELGDVENHRKIIKKALIKAGVPSKLITAFETRALRSGRRQTGEHVSNRKSRWKLSTADPQYGTELDCKIILNKLLGQMLCFQNAPDVDPIVRRVLEDKYLGHAIHPGSYKDILLLETLDYDQMRDEVLNPTHGISKFHIGHEDPTIHPKHAPANVGWRSYRSNLIQGNMTLREARIYIIKLIARYFELGELDMH